MTKIIEIDGSTGEGGGQIIRSSMALSLLTQTPVRIRKIRAGRKKPGLQAQHLVAVKAATTIGRATIDGAALNSTELFFHPHTVASGNYEFDIGTAGSTSLVFQTVFPALLRAESETTLAIKGGTHNSMAPPFDFLDRCYLPLVRKLGGDVEIELDKYGFYPAGGGRMQAVIRPSKLRGFDLLERGTLLSRKCTALVSNLPTSIGEREIKVVQQGLDWRAHECSVTKVVSRGPGNVVFTELDHENVSEVSTQFGRKGVPAEQVAEEVVADTKTYLSSTGACGEYLADQWMLPLAMAVAETWQTHAFSATVLSQHSETHLRIIEMFLPIHSKVKTESQGRVLITLSRK